MHVLLQSKRLCLFAKAKVPIRESPDGVRQRDYVIRKFRARMRDLIPVLVQPVGHDCPDHDGNIIGPNAPVGSVSTWIFDDPRNAVQLDVPLALRCHRNRKQAHCLPDAHVEVGVYIPNPTRARQEMRHDSARAPPGPATAFRRLQPPQRATPPPHVMEPLRFKLTSAIIPKMGTHFDLTLVLSAILTCPLSRETEKWG